MNATLVRPTEQVEVNEQEQAVTELDVVELAYVGGGMANFSFV